MNRSKYFLLVFLLVFCSSCTDLNTEMSDYLEENVLYNSNKGDINLKEALSLDFDEIYVFGEFTPDDTISEIMGTEYHSTFSQIQDSEQRHIFLKKGIIVYQEDVSTSANWSIIKSYGLTSSYPYFHYKGNQTYKVRRKKLSDNSYIYSIFKE